ncbi:MAG: alpha-ketoacid dehydrogenase subunit beta [Dethiobacter sp.]|jgi:pyruvate/2-oxoglutarate/acetoin dehydrogenase E1 component|nr:alpha-ketoacid dehydrogenase subunit beta [Dethiobacter sp.]
MREITYREALREALREEMNRDSRVFLLGEDIACYGGAFKVTQGLFEEFGEDRVKDTPLSESVIAGASVGAAMVGVRPVAEIMFADFLPLVMDHIANSAAKMCYMSAGEISVPMVVRAAQGAGTSSGAHHCQSVEGWLMNIPGIKLVLPSTPYDAKGLLKSAIRDNNPVVFLEHKLLYATKGPVPEEEYLVPLGKADIKRQGSDITIIATSQMVLKAQRAAEELAKDGISAEVVDPRTLLPLDKDTILRSVRKTKRVLIVHEACLTGGAGAEIAAVIALEAFDYLDAPVTRIGAPDIPVPFSPTMEKFFIQGEEQIIKSAKALLA